MNDHHLTPLRYPGGKSKLSPLIKRIYEQNQLHNADYIEPFAGGAGIAMGLLFNEYAPHIHINDFDKSIYAFWHSVVNNPEDICELIREKDITVDEWEKQKDIHLNEDSSLIELGFSTFYLNRTNVSGILKGGIIGGKDQQGEWKIDARFNKDSLIKRIRRIASYKNRISVYNMDAYEFLNIEMLQKKSNSLIYLDPPYYNKGKQLYTNYYKYHDHAKIAGLCSRLHPYWIVSYDNVSEINTLYKKYKKFEYSLTYSASKRLSGPEVMFFCDRLEIPDSVQSTF
jgi:DNA adenine methylase